MTVITTRSSGSGSLPPRSSLPPRTSLPVVDPLPSRTHRALVLILCTCAAVLWSWLGLFRLATAHHHTFDLAEYTRLAWGLAHGQPWDSVMGGHVLGGHMPWVLAPLGALGALFGTAQTLIVAQACAIAFSGYILFRIAARAVGQEAGVLLAVAYLAYPNLGHVATYEAHPGAFALPAFFLAFDALERAQARKLVIACALALACRASFALEVMCLCALAIFPNQGSLAQRAALRRTGIALGLCACAYLALSMFYLRPTFGGMADAPVTGSLDAHFGKWGGSPFGIASALLTRPGDVLDHLLAPERLRYLPMVLAPLAFLPLLSPRALLVAAPALCINLASEFPTTTRIDSHYLTPAVPALAVGAALALRKLAYLPRVRARVPRSERVTSPLALVALFVSALASVLAGGMPWSRDFAGEDFRADVRTLAVDALLARIPEDAPVQAPDVFLPQLAERRAVHRGPPPNRNTEYVVLDLSHRSAFAQREDLLRTRQEPIARSWLARPELSVIARAGDYALLRRGIDPRAGYVRRYLMARVPSAPTPTDQRLTECLLLRSAILQPRLLTLTLLARGACPEDLAVRIGTSEAELDTGAGSRPRARPRVDLLCDGVMSPAHFRAGDVLRSEHPLSTVEHDAMLERGIWIGALRSSGARPEPWDPRAVQALAPAPHAR